MIFVTGGTGLAGSHLLYELVSRGKKVKALKRNNSRIANVKKVFSYYSSDHEELFSKIEWADGDILDYESVEAALDGVDEIYHTAAVVSFNPKEKSEVLGNIQGTRNIVNAALEKGVKNLCFVSSIAALGEPVNGFEMDENCQWTANKKRTAYSFSKHHSEMEVWRGAAEGLNVAVIIPSVILGPGFWNTGSSLFFKVIYNGLLFYTKGYAGFVDVRDVAKIMVCLMEKKIYNDRFIVNSENLTFEQIFKMLAGQYNIKPPKIAANKFMTEAGWRIAEIISLFTRKPSFLTKESARASQEKFLYSNKKIINKLNYSFIPVEKTLQDFCKIYINERKG